MNYFREERETEKIAFLYVSDDMEWGKTELKKLQKKHKDIYFEGKSIFRKKNAEKIAKTIHWFLRVFSFGTSLETMKKSYLKVLKFCEVSEKLPIQGRRKV